MNAKPISVQSVTAIADQLSINLIDAIHQAQYDILDNNTSRPDVRIKAILAFHELEKATHNQFHKLQRYLEY